MQEPYLQEGVHGLPKIKSVNLPGKKNLTKAGNKNMVFPIYYPKDRAS
jgi:hypothetical protein